MGKLGCWIEAMRLRTLPVSVAGVIVAVTFAVAAGECRWLPAVLCMAFAVLAQIASNFANEYYDFKGGLDKAGRVGPRRGVTEGDITPRAMLAATFGTLAVACIIGLSLIHWGGWWLLGAGVVIALGVICYSAGPYPLSHHGLGEVAVVCFFGLAPVALGYYVITGLFNLDVLAAGTAFGLMGANVLIVNNYRDCDDDALVGKRTLAVMWGRKWMSRLYLFNGYIAMTLMLPWLLWEGVATCVVGVSYLVVHTLLYVLLVRRHGPRLNPLLGMTACLMLVTAVGLLLAVAL